MSFDLIGSFCEIRQSLSQFLLVHFRFNVFSLNCSLIHNFTWLLLLNN